MQVYKKSYNACT